MTLTIEQVKERALTKHDWTYADFASLPAESRYELFNGNLTMSPSPKFEHQLTCDSIKELIKAWDSSSKAYYVVSAPMDVVLSGVRVVQPDLVVLAKSRRAIIEDGIVQGAPDLVVEVASPSTLRHDRIVKFRYYEEAGVQEYWLVDPAVKTVEVYSLQATGELAGHYDLMFDAEQPEQRWSIVLPGLRFTVADVFESLVNFES